MTKFELQQRTKKFHVEIIKLCESFPKNAAGFETAKQLIRSAGSDKTAKRNSGQQNPKIPKSQNQKS